MLLTSLSFLVISVLAQAPIAMAGCNKTGGDSMIQLDETATDIVIFSMHAPNAKVTYSVTSNSGSESLRADINAFFMIRVQPTGLVELVLIRALNMDMKNPVRDYEINVRCTENVSKKMVEYRQYLFVMPVDEYKTVFPIQHVFIIREDTPVLTRIALIPDLFTDDDYDVEQFKLSYNITNYRDPATDGQFYFYVDVTGKLLLKKALDYDKGQKLFNLNVTVTKNFLGPFASWPVSFFGVIEIRISNVDDNAVEFIYHGCSTRCPSANYLAKTSPKFTGKIEIMKYGPIRAVDLDGDQVEYTLIGGSPSLFKTFFMIDTKSGDLSIVRPLEDISFVISNLIIQATSYSTLPERKYQKPATKTYSFLLIWVAGRSVDAKIPFFPDLFEDLGSTGVLGSSGEEKSIPKPYSTLLVVLMMAAVSL